MDMLFGEYRQIDKVRGGNGVDADAQRFVDELESRLASELRQGGLTDLHEGLAKLFFDSIKAGAWDGVAYMNEYGKSFIDVMLKYNRMEVWKCGLPKIVNAQVKEFKLLEVQARKFMDPGCKIAPQEEQQLKDIISGASKVFTTSKLSADVLTAIIKQSYPAAIALSVSPDMLKYCMRMPDLDGKDAGQGGMTREISVESEYELMNEVARMAAEEGYINPIGGRGGDSVPGAPGAAGYSDSVNPAAGAKKGGKAPKDAL